MGKSKHKERALDKGAAKAAPALAKTRTKKPDYEQSEFARRMQAAKERATKGGRLGSHAGSAQPISVHSSALLQQVEDVAAAPAPDFVDNLLLNESTANFSSRPTEATQSVPRSVPSQRSQNSRDSNPFALLCGEDEEEEEDMGSDRRILQVKPSALAGLFSQS